MTLRPQFFVIGIALFVLSAPSSVHAYATFIIDNIDPPGVGFNDPTAVQPLGGNDGTTLGEQRMIAVQYAADIYGELLDSEVPIVVEASFADLPCTDPDMTQMGEGAAVGVVTNPSDSGADPQLYYPSALADSLQGEDVFPGDPDIQAAFNGAVDRADCLPDLDWYYGLDGQCGTDVDLVSVVLHELAHGLGFTYYVDPQTGELFNGRADHFSAHIYDNSIGKHWPDMINAERLASYLNVRQVVWDGPEVTAEAPDYLDRGAPRLVLTPEVAGFSGFVSEANFGPRVSSTPIEAELVLGDPVDGCDVVTNAAGKIVLLLMVSCHVGNMVNYAEVGGAVGVLVAFDAGWDSPPMSLDVTRDDYTYLNPLIGIPSLSVSASDSALLEAALNDGTVTASMFSDDGVLAGADASGKLLLAAIDPVMDAVSILHWDNLARPHLLMEPIAVRDEPHHDLDLTLAMLRDVGWPRFCGNGTLEQEEECDDGQQNSDTVPDACRSDCVSASCGDGVKDTGEECDDGQQNSDTAADACRSDCVSASCGDGVKDTGEECDDGDSNDDDTPQGCSTTCTINPPDTESDAGPSGAGTGGDAGSSGAGTGGDAGPADGFPDGGPGQGQGGAGQGAETQPGGGGNGGCSCNIAALNRSGYPVGAIGSLLFFVFLFRRRF
jgi:hypothetical protein